MQQYLITLFLLKSCLLSAQPVEPVQVEYSGETYWKYYSVDTMNNTPFKLYYMYDKNGTYLGWVHKFPRNGKWINFYEEDSTKVASIFEIKDSLLDGKSTQYEINGKKESEYNFLEGKLNGFMRYWNDAGLLVIEHEYHYNGPEYTDPPLQVGVWRNWYYNGRLKTIRNFSEGKANGAYLEYYENGNIEIEKFYKNGLLDSFQTTYYPNGQIEERVEFKNGEFVPNNPHKRFHANGSIESVGNLMDNRKVGVWTHFYENGRKASEGEYGTYIYEHEHGNMYFNVRIGFWRYWYDSGNLKAEGYYGTENNVIISDISAAKSTKKDGWKYFDVRGKAITEAEFEKMETARRD